jgi:hypothetical protein
MPGPPRGHPSNLPYPSHAPSSLSSTNETALARVEPVSALPTPTPPPGEGFLERAARSWWRRSGANTIGVGSGVLVGGTGAVLAAVVASGLPGPAALLMWLAVMGATSFTMVAAMFGITPAVYDGIHGEGAFEKHYQTLREARDARALAKVREKVEAAVEEVIMSEVRREVADRVKDAIDDEFGDVADTVNDLEVRMLHSEKKIDALIEETRGKS